jgi:DNA-binding transcriptional LysR family regulator
MEGARMITSRVEYFLAAWRERSFSRAALRCGVSQPSLTNGIKSLEEDLGGPLFQRYPHFGLTDLGKRVLPLMKRMERAAKEARLLQRDRFIVGRDRESPILTQRLARP